MKKEYMKPEAEKLTFDFTENVIASRPTTDASTEWWVCHTKPVYNDSVADCAPKTEKSNEYWACE